MAEDQSAGDKKRLKNLVIQIKKSQGLLLKGVRKSVVHAKEIGEYLIEAKSLVPRGEWMIWVRDNCDLSSEQVRRYCRLAINWEKLKATNHDVENMTITTAVSMLAELKSGGDGKPKAAKTATATLDISAEDLKEAAYKVQANGLAFEDNSAEEEVLNGLLLAIQRQIRHHANKSTGDIGEKIQLAVALLLELKKRLDIEILADSPKADADSVTAETADLGSVSVDNENLEMVSESVSTNGQLRLVVSA